MHILDYIKNEVNNPEFLVVNYKSINFDTDISNNLNANVFNKTTCQEESLDVNLENMTVVDTNEFFEGDAFTIITKDFILPDEDKTKFLRYIRSLLEQIKRNFPDDKMNFIFNGLQISLSNLLINLCINDSIITIESQTEKVFENVCDKMLYKFELMTQCNKSNHLPHEWFSVDKCCINDTILMTTKFLGIALNATTKEKANVLDSYLDLSLKLDYLFIPSSGKPINVCFELVKYLHKILSYVSDSYISNEFDYYITTIFGHKFNEHIPLSNIKYADCDTIKLLGTNGAKICRILYPVETNSIKTKLSYNDNLFELPDMETNKIVHIRNILRTY